jgi:UDP-2,3-diacylglucosamine pyrophosphatase LpxH
MRTTFVSDAHLAGPDDPAQRAFLAFLRRLETDELVLGGDVFQHWWHFGDSPFPAYAEVVEALARFRLVVLPGNHDFTAPRFFARRGARTEGMLRHGSVRINLDHGDGADTSAGYAAVSALLRGRPFGALVDALGPERGWAFLRRIAGSGVVRPDPLLIEAQARLAATVDADVVVYGHTHAPRMLPGPPIYVHSGAFPGSWVVVDDGFPRLVYGADS